ncbi:unnamed protein product [Arctia plantaginis]|uniref:Uncharacterized protein n=1 Tax=Arctia plantaginis TaxID=874455 RepID=A0A8S0ZTN6_ARCPL|nr:unnamed protein product [Arctia plantaginis]CAB3248433.1 unnamed protein product [Arctia plantaginis]
MDFNNDLAAFQGALLSVDHVHPLPSLTSKGGNEAKVHHVIQSLKRFLKVDGYIDEKGLVREKIPKMRKLAMYLILNADFPVLHSMIHITEIEPILWSIPPLPKYLMCEMIWQLHMETFLYEIIAKCTPQLGIEVAESFLENFKYFGPTECISKLGNISAACYALICRINCFKLEDSIALNHILTGIYETFQSFLKYYTDPPNKHLLDELSRDELYKYKGQRFKNILNLVYNCVTMYTQDTNPNCDDPLYKVTYKTAILHNTTCKVCDSPSQLLLDFVDNGNLFLLDVFKDVVMDISVDIFCAWSEFEEEDKSMQQSIGELCDKVLVLLRSIDNIAEHPVVRMIQQMARKPTDIKDIINATDTATILNKINKCDEESVEWIHALVHKDQLLRHMDLVHVIHDHLNIFDEAECFELFKAFENVAVDTATLVNRELLLSTKIRLFHECNVLNKHTIMKEHFKEKIFINVKMEDDFDLRLNIMFNRFVGDIDVDFTDVFTLFYQNPRKVYTKIFGLATQNTKLIEPMSKLMQLLIDYSEYCYNTETEPCMITIMKFILNKCLQDGYSCNFLKFICDLKNNNIVSTSQLLMLVIMPTIHEALLVKDVDKINIQMELLIKAFPVEELLPYRPPMLVMMAQILETVRLRALAAFRVLSLKVVQKVIKFQQSIVRTYINGIPEREDRWLRQKVQALKMNPLNFYYYQPLWKRDNKCYFETISEVKLREVGLNLVATRLALSCPWTTVEEWCEMYNNFVENNISPLDALKMYHAAVDVMTKKIGSFRTTNTVNCLLYCYGNLIHIIRYKFLSEPLTNERVSATCSLLAKNLKDSNEIDVNDIGAVVMPLFAYLAERKNDYTVNVPKYFRDTKYLHIVNRYIPSDDNNVE